MAILMKKKSKDVIEETRSDDAVQATDSKSGVSENAEDSKDENAEEEKSLATETVQKSYELGERAICAFMDMAGNCGNLGNLVLQSDEVKAVEAEGADVADLIITMSQDVSTFDGNWNTENQGGTVEVDYDGKKDTIVTSHPVEASFFDPTEREVESVHVVQVKLPPKKKVAPAPPVVETPPPELSKSKSKKSKRKAKKQLKESKRGSFFKAKSSRASI